MFFLFYFFPPVITGGKYSTPKLVRIHSGVVVLPWKRSLACQMWPGQMYWTICFIYQIKTRWWKLGKKNMAKVSQLNAIIHNVNHGPQRTDPYTVIASKCFRVVHCGKRFWNWWYFKRTKTMWPSCCLLHLRWKTARKGQSLSTENALGPSLRNNKVRRYSTPHHISLIHPAYHQNNRPSPKGFAGASCLPC